jgi:hypothetical protein
VCGKAYDAVPIHVTTEDGRPRPVNLDDQKQVGQRQALGGRPAGSGGVALSRSSCPRGEAVAPPPPPHPSPSCNLSFHASLASKQLLYFF